jgi:hypothetical protein
MLGVPVLGRSLDGLEQVFRWGRHVGLRAHPPHVSVPAASEPHVLTFQGRDPQHQAGIRLPPFLSIRIVASPVLFPLSFVINPGFFEQLQSGKNGRPKAGLHVITLVGPSKRPLDKLQGDHTNATGPKQGTDLRDPPANIVGEEPRRFFHGLFPGRLSRMLTQPWASPANRNTTAPRLDGFANQNVVEMENQITKPIFAVRLLHTRLLEYSAAK